MQYLLSGLCEIRVPSWGSQVVSHKIPGNPATDSYPIAPGEGAGGQGPGKALFFQEALEQSDGAVIIGRALNLLECFIMRKYNQTNDK